MKKIWINKVNSFKEAEEFDRKYYARMTPEERLSIVQELREIHFKFLNPDSKPRLQRVIKVVQMTQGGTD